MCSTSVHNDHEVFGSGESDDDLDVDVCIGEMSRGKSAQNRKQILRRSADDHAAGQSLQPHSP